MATINFPEGVATWVDDASNHIGQQVYANGTLIADVNYCGRFALYYLNRHGAWDAFLFESPRSERTDAINSFSYHKDYVNTDQYAYGRKKYVSEVVPAWKLYTGWLTEEQAERFALNLVPSSQVFLHDLDEDKLWTVTITDTSVLHKTHVNQGHKLIRYEVNLQASQDLVRR